MNSAIKLTPAEYKPARDKAFVARHSLRKGDVPKASDLAYRLNALIRVCCLAKDNDNGPMFKDWDGLGLSLELAESWAGELIDAIEHLETDAEKAGAA